jgi:hypothetical protein
VIYPDILTLCIAIYRLYLGLAWFAQSTTLLGRNVADHFTTWCLYASLAVETDNIPELDHLSLYMLQHTYKPCLLFILVLRNPLISVSH